MSGMSSYLRRSCWLKIDSELLVYTPSKTKLCEIESLLHGQYKILFSEKYVLANVFLFTSFLSESTGELLKFDSLGVPVLQLTSNSNSYCTQKQDWIEIPPCQDKRLMTGGVKKFLSCNPFSECSFFGSQFFSLETKVEVRLEKLPRDVV